MLSPRLLVAPLALVVAVGLAACTPEDFQAAAPSSASRAASGGGSTSRPAAGAASDSTAPFAARLTRIGYSLTVPSGWAPTAADPDADLKITGPTTDGIPSAVQITSGQVGSVDAALGAPLAFETLRVAMVATPQFTGVGETEQTTFAGEDARYVDADYSEYPGSRVRLLLVIHHDRAVLLAFRGSPRLLQQPDVFDQLAGSWTWS